MKRFKDLSNMRFNKLVAIEVDHFQKTKNSTRTYWRTYWKCKCDCGNYTVVRSDCLTTGNTQSCGCYNKTCREKPNSIKKHKLYRVYWAMKQRCYDSNSKHYDRYGGRGIIICDEWLNNYELFYNWSMNNGYKEGLTIDRINNNGNYEPKNCRFITIAEQQRNKTQRKSKSYYESK